jgi:hypothetical protein
MYTNKRLTNYMSMKWPLKIYWRWDFFSPFYADAFNLRSFDLSPKAGISKC